MRIRFVQPVTLSPNFWPISIACTNRKIRLISRKETNDRSGKEIDIVNSLDQDPPEAAEAGAVWHFARVRYSHFLLDQVYTVPIAFLSSSCVSISSATCSYRSI